MRVFGRIDIDKFKRSVIPDGLLEDIVEWIVDEYSPEDLFSKEVLREWAFDNGLIDPEDVEPE